MSCCYRTAAPSPSPSTPASTPTLAAPALARKDGAFTYTPPWRWMPSRKTSMDWPTCTGGLALLGNPARRKTRLNRKRVTVGWPLHSGVVSASPPASKPRWWPTGSLISMNSSSACHPRAWKFSCGQPRTASWPLPRESGYSTGSASNPCRGKSICFCRPSLGSDRLARLSYNYALVD